METDEFVLDNMRRFRQLQMQLMGKLYTLSHSEIAVLQEIRHAGGNANVTDMARALVVSPPAISRTLRQLREKGLVDSRPDENDRRGGAAAGYGAAAAVFCGGDPANGTGTVETDGRFDGAAV